MKMIHTPNSRCRFFNIYLKVYRTFSSLLLIVPLILICCCTNNESGRPTTLKLNGLQVTIESAEWISIEEISIVYQIENVGPTQWWLRNIEPLNIKIWGFDGKRVYLGKGAEEIYILIVDELLEKRHTSIKADIRLKVPQYAWLVSVELAASGLETQKVEIK